MIIDFIIFAFACLGMGTAATCMVFYVMRAFE
jgi:hypothetical protein